MELFLCCWKYHSHERFDQFLRHVGVPYLVSKFADNMPAFLTYSKSLKEEEYAMELSTLIKKTGGTFRLGEEFQDTSMGGSLLRVIKYKF